MQKPRLELSAELTLEEKIMTELAVLEEQIHNLVKHVDVLTEEIKNLKNEIKRQRFKGGTAYA